MLVEMKLFLRNSQWAVRGCVTNVTLPAPFPKQLCRSEETVDVSQWALLPYAPRRASSTQTTAVDAPPCARGGRRVALQRHDSGPIVLEIRWRLPVSIHAT